MLMELFSCNNFLTAATIACYSICICPLIQVFLILQSINSNKFGWIFKANTLDTSLRPPRILCSSAVTIHFVLANDFRIASSSNGLIV
jgi:hypothetical protein